MHRALRTLLLSSARSSGLTVRLSHYRRTSHASKRSRRCSASCSTALAASTSWWPMPESRRVLFGPVGKAGFTMNYVVARDSSRVELLVQRDDGPRQLLRLKEDREDIQASFGGPLV